jgi:hypothetical protein
MISAIGLVVLFVCVFGGFIMAGGSMAPIIKAAPIETFIIGGAAIGAMVAGNSMTIVKGFFGGIGHILSGPKFNKQDFLDCIFLVSKIMKVLKAEGAVALVLCRADIAHRYTPTPVFIKGAVLRSRRYGSFEVFAPAQALEVTPGPTVDAARAVFEIVAADGLPVQGDVAPAHHRVRERPRQPAGNEKVLQNSALLGLHVDDKAVRRIGRDFRLPGFLEPAILAGSCCRFEGHGVSIASS